MNRSDGTSSDNLTGKFMLRTTALSLTSIGRIHSQCSGCVILRKLGTHVIDRLQDIEVPGISLLLPKQSP
jgi:hypothetical protein